MKANKKVYTFRMDIDLVTKAREAGLDLTEMIHAMLAKAIKDKRCPYCGQKKN